MLSLDFIILLTGQSNALGVGGTYDQLCEDDQPDNRIYGYNYANDTWNIFDLRNAVGSKKMYHQCLAFHYAKKMLKTNPNWTIGIIICGRNGQSITRWVKPYTCKCASSHLLPSLLWTYGKQDRGDIYDMSVLMVNAALAHCDENTCVNMIMWHQGESDFMETHMWYYQRLTKVINQYKKEVWFGESGEFICGQLLENGITDKMNYVLSMFKLLNYTSLNLYTDSYDGIHFNNNSYRTFEN